MPAPPVQSWRYRAVRRQKHGNESEHNQTHSRQTAHYSEQYEPLLLDRDHDQE